LTGSPRPDPQSIDAEYPTFSSEVSQKKFLKIDFSEKIFLRWIALFPQDDRGNQRIAKNVVKADEQRHKNS
jgi:hypothetical protein